MTPDHPATFELPMSANHQQTTPRKIPLCRTEITPEAQQTAVRVLGSGWVTMGAESAAFENELAAWRGGDGVHFIPVHHLPYYRDLMGPDGYADLTEADRLFPQLLSLPMHPGLSDDDVDRVCEQIAALAG